MLLILLFDHSQTIIFQNNEHVILFRLYFIIASNTCSLHRGSSFFRHYVLYSGEIVFIISSDIPQCDNSNWVTLPGNWVNNNIDSFVWCLILDALANWSFLTLKQLSVSAWITLSEFRIRSTATWFRIKIYLAFVFFRIYWLCAPQKAFWMLLISTYIILSLYYKQSNISP